MQRFGAMELSESPFPFDRKTAKNSESAGPETSFMKAVYKDSKAEFLAQAKRLVQASSEPLDGATVSKLLHLCCKCDSAECASALLGGELGTIPSVDELDDSLNSPLHTAAMADAARCVDVLLKKGARTDMRNCDGQLAVDLSLSDKRMGINWDVDVHSIEDLVHLMEKKDLTVVKLLSRKTKEIADVAYASAVQGRIYVLAALLIVASDKVTASVFHRRDSYSGSKENLTIYESLVWEALYLVRTPPPWRAAAKRTFTAETENEKAKKRKLLLCEIELLQHFGAVAQCSGADKKVKSPLIRAAQVGDADIIRMLLKTNADVNDADGEGNCALHWILKWSRLCPLQIKILLLLLEHGARVSQRNKLGLTAFHIAASDGNLEALKVLLLEDPNGVKYETDMKETPLFFAVRHESVDRAKSVDCAKLLLTSGANSEILNLRGQRAIDLAISQDMRYILMKQTSVSLINHAFPSQHKCPALGLTDEDTSTKRHVISSSKAEVANKGTGTTNSAIRTDNSEVVIGVDSRISYAGQRRDTQRKFERLSSTILATMAGNVAECQKTWTCMKEHVSNNILEGNEPASIYSIATVGYNMERTIDDAACECFIVGVQNDKAEIHYLLDEYSETLKRRVRKWDEIKKFRVIGSGAIYASDELKRKLEDREDGPSFEEAIELTKYALLQAALQDSFTGGPLWVLHIMADRIEKKPNNAVELYIEFYHRFREVEETSIFLFYIPEIDKKMLRKTLREKGRVDKEGHPLTQLEGRYYIHRVIYQKEEAATLLYDGAARVSKSKRPPFTDWPTLKVFQIKGKKIFLARQSREMLLSLKFSRSECQEID